jgi:hypothetical protein
VSWSPSVIAAEVLLLSPLLALAFVGDRFNRTISRLPATSRIAFPAPAAIPYFLVTQSTGNFRWPFALLYAGLPVLLVGLLDV